MEEFFKFLIKGYKALDGWERLWAILIVFAIYVIARLFVDGTFDGIIYRIKEVLGIAK